MKVVHELLYVILLSEATYLLSALPTRRKPYGYFLIKKIKK